MTALVDPTDPRRLAWRSTWASLGVLLLTVVHHVYGAWLYATPWRLHVVGVAAVAGAAIVGASAAFVASRGRRFEPLALAVFTLLTVVIPISGFGIFEGLYNHVLKIVLFLVGTRSEVMDRLFPAPTYSMPNDLFFEASGVLQVAVAALVARSHGLLVRRVIREPRR
jgi:hypothetical protein